MDASAARKDTTAWESWANTLIASVSASLREADDTRLAAILIESLPAPALRALIEQGAGAGGGALGTLFEPAALHALAAVRTLACGVLRGGLRE